MDNIHYMDNISHYMDTLYSVRYYMDTLWDNISHRSDNKKMCCNLFHEPNP